MKTHTTLRPAAQYLRTSTAEQRYSLESQAMAIAAYASIKGYEVVKTYVDGGRSGVTMKQREGLRRLLADVVGGRAPFRTILVLDISRWGRFQDADEGGHYEYLCRTAGVEVLYSGELFGEGLAGSVQKHIKRVMAADFSRELSVKVRAAKRRLALAGRTAGGPCPFGMARQVIYPDGALGPVLERGERKSSPEQSLRMVPEGPEQSRTLRRIFHLFLNEHLSPAQIAIRLNAEGQRWIGGEPWTRSRVSPVLRCELVTGRQPYGKTTKRLDRPLQKNASASWGRVQIFPPIVSPRIFKAAQVRMQTLGGHLRKTDREMLNDLRRIHARHGRVRSSLVEATPGVHTARAYFIRFGSLARACELIGITYEGAPRVRRPDGSRASRGAVLDGLRRIYAANGRIDGPLCHADRSLPTLGWLRAEFGGLAAAFDAAGVEHTTSHRHRKVRPHRKGAADSGDPDIGVQTGPRGGRYVVHPSGRRTYGL